MKKRKISVKGILLDLDGTIVDSKEAYREAATTAFRATGQKIVDDKIVTEIPKRLEQSLPIEEILKGVDVQKFLDTYLKAYYHAAVLRGKPLPKIEITLQKLSEKAKLALITMRYVPKQAIVDELDRFGLTQYFQSIITALDVDEPKPSPEALVKCAMQLDVEMCACAIVGDSVADVKAGKNAGIITVAVLSGIFSREELSRENPDLILESVNQLPGFLE